MAKSNVSTYGHFAIEWFSEEKHTIFHLRRYEISFESVNFTWFALKWVDIFNLWMQSGSSMAAIDSFQQIVVMTTLVSFSVSSPVSRNHLIVSSIVSEEGKEKVCIVRLIDRQ